MKLLIMSFVIASSGPAFADIIDSCQLMGEKEVVAEGLVNIHKAGETLTIAIDGAVLKPANEAGKIKGEDLVAKKSIYTETGLEEQIKQDDEVQRLVARLGSEQPKELKIYQGKNFEENGGGLMLYRLEGEKGSVKGFIFIGMGGLFCD
jgi:hypothetical protein